MRVLIVVKDPSWSEKLSTFWKGLKALDPEAEVVISPSFVPGLGWDQIYLDSLEDIPKVRECCPTAAIYLVVDGHATLFHLRSALAKGANGVVSLDEEPKMNNGHHVLQRELYLEVTRLAEELSSLRADVERFGQDLEKLEECLFHDGLQTRLALVERWVQNQQEKARVVRNALIGSLLSVLANLALTLFRFLLR